MTWSDYNCPKGFHIFDTETRELERVSNPNKIFKKIHYNDQLKDYDRLEIDMYNNTFVKLFIADKRDADMYDRFIDRMYNDINVHELQVVEDMSDIGASVREDILEQGEDTLTFLGNYIEQVETDIDKQKLKQFAKELYAEANE
jgi:hypothetical protein